MRRKFILPYRKGSESVSNLIKCFGGEVKGIKTEGSKYSPKPTDIVINWGNSNPDVNLVGATVLNQPQEIADVTNKLKFFRRVSDLDVENRPRIPHWTQNKEEALGWIQDGKVAFARTKLTGHSGEGIVILENEQDVVSIADNTLIVKYVPKKREFRLHFFEGEVFDIQEKKRSRDVPEEDVNWRIRSHGNGFIYSRNDMDEVPADVRSQADKTIGCLALTFGAIDIIYNQHHNEAWVLEVNSAPGLEGTTLTKYYEKFQGYFEENQ